MVLEKAKGVKKTWAEIKNDAKNKVRWISPVETGIDAQMLLHFPSTARCNAHYR
jgi:hypothetical protein